MKQKFFTTLFGLFLLGVIFASCEKYKDCEVSQKQYLDDSLISTTQVSPQEVCGDRLKKIEANPEVTVSQSTFGLNQKVVQVYEYK